jgi:hypothetical protein
VATGGVYSTRFIFGITRPSLQYTVPAGHKAVVKCITAYNALGTAANAALDIGGTWIWVASVPGLTSVLQSNLTIVVNAGETMNLAGPQDKMYVHASGFLLAL